MNIGLAYYWLRMTAHLPAQWPNLSSYDKCKKPDIYRTVRPDLYPATLLLPLRLMRFLSSPFV